MGWKSLYIYFIAKKNNLPVMKCLSNDQWDSKLMLVKCQMTREVLNWLVQLFFVGALAWYFFNLF
jgi:hypothetical protein